MIINVFNDKNKQDKITAEGILKGDGNGGVIAAVKGTDYDTEVAFYDATSGEVDLQSLVDSWTAKKQIYVKYYVYHTPTVFPVYNVNWGATTGGWNYNILAQAGKYFLTGSGTIKGGVASSIEWSFKQLAPSDIGAQPRITADGVLKGDGTGNITAADETEVELVDLPQEVFWATYGTTTFSDIKGAYDANKSVKVKYNDEIYSLSAMATIAAVFSCTSGSQGSYKQLSVWKDGNSWQYSNVGNIIDIKRTITLPAASWTGSDPYSQTVDIFGSTANTKVDIQPSEELYDQLVADNVGYLAIKNVDGTFTAVAKGGKPSVDLTVQVTYNNVY